MHLPRSLLSTLYLHLRKSRHALSSNVVILCALDPDALAGCRILQNLLRRDNILYQIIPVSGYLDLERAGKDVIRSMQTFNGGNGGTVVCLGVGGMVDLASQLSLVEEADSEHVSFGGVDVWVVDARRPWNLDNVFGGEPTLDPLEDDAEMKPRRLPGVEGGRIGNSYRHERNSKGGIFVFDDGDIEEELGTERDAFLALSEMPDIDDDGEELDDSDSDSENESLEISRAGTKRKSWSDQDDEDSDSDDDRGPQRRKSNSSSPMPVSPSRPGPRGLLSLGGAGPHHSSDLHSVSPSPGQGPKAPSAATLRRRLLRLRRKNEAVLSAYYTLGASYSEPISSMMYSLACDLGRENNDLLWLTIVGVKSMELYGRTATGVAIAPQDSAHGKPTGWLGLRGAAIRQLLRDEVRRLNPPDLSDSSSGRNQGSIPTTARGPSDTSIRLSPEPKFLLIRHWSLYDSMLHSRYLATKLHIWSENGRSRVHKLLARMGVSLVQSKQSYTHMDMDLKRNLRERLLLNAPLYNLDEIVPAKNTDDKDAYGSKDAWGFVRSWGYSATLSAEDVGVVVGAILEVGKKYNAVDHNGWDRSREVKELVDEDGLIEAEERERRFWDAYDALTNIESLKNSIPTAQHLHRAILRTGTSLIEKRQIRVLRAFRMCLVKEGPDVQLFTHPAALTKLALWLGEAFAEQERSSRGKVGNGGRGTPLVVACLNEHRGCYTVIGTGGGGGASGGWADREAVKMRQQKKEQREKAKAAKRAAREAEKAAIREARALARSDESDEEEEDDDTESEASESESEDEEDDAKQARGYGRNKFGNAFQEVTEQTNARLKQDSFEHCIVEVKKEDLTAFLESLSERAVVG